MRNLAVATLAMALCACATTGSPGPREFLDEQTAATITIVSEPVIFSGVSDRPAGLDAGRGTFTESTNRDYLEMYGIDVNRMGSHRQYFAIQKWLTSKDVEGSVILELTADGDTVEFRVTPEEPRKLGISAPPAPVLSKSSMWWYFPTDTATLRRIAGAGSLGASLVIGERRLVYEIFTDGRVQLGELAAALPGQ